MVVCFDSFVPLRTAAPRRASMLGKGLETKQEEGQLRPI
jgi:hypothetical protein